MSQAVKNVIGPLRNGRPESFLGCKLWQFQGLRRAGIFHLLRELGLAWYSPFG